MPERACDREGFVQAATQEIFGKCQRGSQLKAIKAKVGDASKA
ncbi:MULTISPECIES: hypothetical protein [Nitrosomonas]|nr:MULTISPECIES: hypothetical protein [Nitrosomonas]MEB2331047.1 hypothetical protein [Nitrosomonas sp.]HNR09705.1 hypothetical protein [Nitrosomonas europaea]HRN82959.1 hypothetical protein [Nitrosomonas europaea]